MSRGSDGYVGMLDYGQTHPTSNVRQNNTRGNGNSDYQTMGGQNILAGRAALRWTPSDQLEINLSADYTRERSEAIPTVLIAAGAAYRARSIPLGARRLQLGRHALAGRQERPGGEHELRLRSRRPVQLRYRRQPAWAGIRSSSATRTSSMPRRRSAMPRSSPISRLPVTEFNGSGFSGNVSYDFNDNVQLVYIGSYRKYNSKFGQDQDATPIPVAQLDNELNHHAFTSEVRLNMKSAGGFVEGTRRRVLPRPEGHLHRARRPELRRSGHRLPARPGHHAQRPPRRCSARRRSIPTEALSFTGGLRYTKDEKDYTYFRSNPDGTVPNPATCVVRRLSGSRNPNCLLAGIYNITGSFKGDRTDWRIVGDYRFTDGLDGLRVGLDRLQGRWRQPAAVLRHPAAAVRAGNAHDLRSGLQVRPARPPHAPERCGVPEQVQGHPARQAGVPGIGSVSVPALPAARQHRRGRREGRGARNLVLPGRWPHARCQRQRPRLQVHLAARPGDGLPA